MVTELASWVETYGTASVLAVGGAFIGVLFGFFAQRSRFCLRAAVIEFWHGKFAEKLSVWLLAFASALIAVQALILSGALDIQPSCARESGCASTLSIRFPSRSRISNIHPAQAIRSATAGKWPDSAIRRPASVL